MFEFVTCNLMSDTFTLVCTSRQINLQMILRPAYPMNDYVLDGAPSTRVLRMTRLCTVSDRPFKKGLRPVFRYKD